MRWIRTKADSIPGDELFLPYTKFYLFSTKNGCYMFLWKSVWYRNLMWNEYFSKTDVDNGERFRWNIGSVPKVELVSRC